jgi:hypothetical protein
MEYIVIIVLIILLLIYLLAQSSKKTTSRERYAEAIGELAHVTADKIDSLVYTLTETEDKKKIRLAREELASRNGSLYRYDSYSNKEYLKRLLTVDDKFRISLNILGLTDERWQMIAKNLLYIGIIRKLSRDSFDYSKKLPKYVREVMVSEWSKFNKLKDMMDLLYNSLNFFNIKVEEWVEYGEAVIEMYDLYDLPDLKEFGIITSIMPTEDNLHLL